VFIIVTTMFFYFNKISITYQKIKKATGKIMFQMRITHIRVT